MPIEYGAHFRPRGSRRVTDFIVIHCAATPNSRATPAEAIVRYHMVTLGWRSCGYHVVIERDGTVVSTLAPDAIGAHCRGLNSRSVGVCLIGGLDDVGHPDPGYTAAQWQSLFEIVRETKGAWPEAEVLGHRDAIARGLTRDRPKACPCFDAVTWWAERGAITGEASDDPEPDGDKLRLDQPIRLQAVGVEVDRMEDGTMEVEVFPVGSSEPSPGQADND